MGACCLLTISCLACPAVTISIAMKNLSSVSAQLRSTPRLPVEAELEHWLTQFNQALMGCQQTQGNPRAVLEDLLSRTSQALAVDACVWLPADLRSGLLQGICWQKSKVAPLSEDWHSVLVQLFQQPSLSDPLEQSNPLVLPFQDWLTQVVHQQTKLAATELLPIGQFSKTVNDADEGIGLASRPGTLASFQAALVARTRCQGTTNGLLVLLCSQPRIWLAKEMIMVQTASQHVAIAISQVQLKEQIERQLRHRALITQLAEAIGEGVELEQIYRIATEGLVTSLQVTQGMILSFKYADPQVKGRATNGQSRVRAAVECAYTQSSGGMLPQTLQQALESPSEQRYTFQISDCVVGQSILNLIDTPLLLPPQGSFLPPAPTRSSEDKTGVRETFQAAIAPLFNFSELPSLLAMPLTNQGVSLGCLVLQHHELRRWQPDEVETVKLVAAHLSSALIQFNTLRKVQALVEERTAQLRHSMDVQAKLYEKSRQQVEQLQRMNQVMEEFLSTVSHELLTPLTSMKMAIKMLREAPLNEGQRDRYLHILDHQCSQETRLIRDLLTLQKIETHATALQLHQVDMHALLLELHTVWQELLSERDLSLSPKLPDRPVLLRTDPESLHRILTELLTNAKKYSAPGHSIDVQLDVESGQKIPHIILTIQNTGLAIFPEELPMIFDKFRRGRQAIQQTVPGIGLGLTLARGLTSHLSGAIAATSTPIAETDNWLTRFTLTLPLVPELAH